MANNAQSDRPNRQQRLDLGSERGQTIVLFALSLAVLFGMVGLVLDVGRGYYVHRAMQAQADAAALAGAHALPNTAAAATLARQFSGSTGGKNESAYVSGVQTSVTPRCAVPGTTCSSATAVAVAETARVDTFFAKVLGIDSFDVGARATACQAGWDSSYLIDESTASCIVAPTPCVLGYPFSSSNARTSVVFNESDVLRAFATNSSGPVNTITAWYNDEHALTLGVREVVVKTSTGTTTTDYPIAALASVPSHALHPDVGTMATSGDQAGTDPVGRPMFPALFLTDITSDPTKKDGDWQSFGTAIPPSAVYGTWKGAVETVDKTRTPTRVAVTPDADPAQNDWNLGTGSDTPPAGLSNEGFGAEAVWSVDDLGLKLGHAYRMEFMVHDGDQHQTGGDSGEGCMAAVMPG